ncbi:MAG: hypothetical protein HQL03_14350 [Nitrospirae bacterium]|nr:hypothetical protein [Nitrospirota bacterium]
MKIFVILFGLLISQAIAVGSGPSVAEAADSSFTQADRDRMTRMEERIIRLEDGLKAVNQRLDDNLKAINQKIDDGLKAVNQRLDDNLKAINQRFDAINQNRRSQRGDICADQHNNEQCACSCRFHIVG